MKNLIFLLALLVGGSTVASAQYGPGRYDNRPSKNDRSYDQHDRHIDRLMADIRNDINNGIYRNTLSKKQAKNFISRFEKIERKEDKYARNRMNSRESNEIITDLRRLKNDVDLANRSSRNHRNDRWANSRRY